MTTYDVIVDYDKKKATALYNYLKTAHCENLFGSNLAVSVKYSTAAHKAYKIQSYRNKFKYLYSIGRYDSYDAPIQFEKFMERTVKL